MIRPFGYSKEGDEVSAVTLGHAEGLQAEILTYGGILHRMSIVGRGARRNLVLTLPDLCAYEDDRAYVGGLVGRFANRIAEARFRLGSELHLLNANEGPNHLHGGVSGFGKRVWQVLDYQTAAPMRLKLARRSPAGEEGYPGNLDVTAEFVVDELELRLCLEARTDRLTAVNLTYHPYFNLSGDAACPVDHHQLRIHASHYLPVGNALLIPTGEIASVAGTPFDFRSARTLGSPALSSHPQLANARGYDHCWVLDAERECDAELVSPESGIAMRIYSEREAVQFYGGQSLPHEHHGLHGLCIEPQGFPNSVNEPRFPGAILTAGETYRSEFRYRFFV